MSMEFGDIYDNVSEFKKAEWEFTHGREDLALRRLEALCAHLDANRDRQSRLVLLVAVEKLAQKAGAGLGLLTRSSSPDSDCVVV